ncbi:hypothetical protein KX436_24465, partial [Escherichia coli]|nr:hypothetical protein [Escherichia coli]MCD4236941.1 hypothetical protein [Escherichia coli]
LRSSCPSKIPVISKLALVLDIYPSLSLILRYIHCLAFQGAGSFKVSSFCGCIGGGGCWLLYYRNYRKNK